MKINAGQLDEKIEVWYETEGSKNEFGETDKTATLLLTTFAKRIESVVKTDQERLSNNTQILTSNQTQWLIRWTPQSITPKMWVVRENVKYGINQHPTEVGRKQYFILTTEQKDNV